MAATKAKHFGLYFCIIREHLEVLQQKVKKFVEQGKALLPYKIQGVTKDGDPIWLHGMYNLIEYGSHPAILGHVLDATQEKRMEAILWNSGQELRILSWKLLTAQEMERKRIPSDLHDGIGQHLNGIRFTLENFLKESGKMVGLDFDSLKRVILLTNETIAEVRTIAMDLRPSLLDDLGIVSTLS